MANKYDSIGDDYCRKLRYLISRKDSRFVDYAIVIVILLSPIVLLILAFGILLN